MRSSILLIAIFVALAHAAYTITYTGYLDNRCSEVDAEVTGHIFYDTCALEYVKAHRTGKITFINSEYLTSCDYSDQECGVMTVCENYTNSLCYASNSVEFSNKYSWTEKEDGSWEIMYTSYTDKTCTSVDVAGHIFFDTCSPEYVVTPKSGKITFINDEYLTSCDYADPECTQLTICENYTNSICYGSQFIQFSNMYSWTRTDDTPTSSPSEPTSAPSTSSPSEPTSAPSQPTSAPSQPTSAPLPTLMPSNPSNPASSEYIITYTAYEDNVCSEVDESKTGHIFAYTCAPEYRRAPQTGKIVFINDEYLTSCDYSDQMCSESALVVCENYTNANCYGSTTSEFSNKYSWTSDGNGGYTITYTSYSDKTCTNEKSSGHIFENNCAQENRKKHQSGMITFINDEFLTSCDYSDTDCKVLTLCENYTNSVCYGSSIVSFSNKYSWVKNDSPLNPSNPTSAPSPSGSENSNDTPSTSGASIVVAGILSVLAIVAMF